MKRLSMSKEMHQTTIAHAGFLWKKSLALISQTCLTSLMVMSKLLKALQSCGILPINMPLVLLEERMMPIKPMLTWCLALYLTLRVLPLVIAMAQVIETLSLKSPNAWREFRSFWATRTSSLVIMLPGSTSSFSNKLSFLTTSLKEHSRRNIHL